MAPLTPLGDIMAAALIAVTTGIIVRMYTTKRCVKDVDCEKIQLSCQRLLLEKIGNLATRINSLEKKIDDLAETVNDIR